MDQPARVRARVRSGDLELWVWPQPKDFKPEDLRPERMGPIETTGPVLIGWNEDDSEPELEALTVVGQPAILVAGRKDGEMHLVVSLGDRQEFFFGSSREDLLAQAGGAALWGWARTGPQPTAVRRSGGIGNPIRDSIVRISDHNAGWRMWP